MTALLARNNYGKSSIRLVKVARGRDVHEMKDLTVDVRFEGEFGRAYEVGDNTMVLPTDTMKNTVYALAHDALHDDVEVFGLVLSEHFRHTTPDVRTVRVELTDHLWDRLLVEGKPHRHTFVRSGEKRTAVVTRSGQSVTIEAGLEDVSVLKTAGSAFEDFLVDRYTTLEDTSERIFATTISAVWLYASPDVDFGLRWKGIRKTLLDTFAEHESRSVQHTLYAMGEAALEICDDMMEIRLALPNRHHIPFDLSPFGQENRNEIFLVSEQPYGAIGATIRRK
jgi:urate oxidase